MNTVHHGHDSFMLFWFKSMEYDPSQERIRLKFYCMSLFASHNIDIFYALSVKYESK